MGYSISVQCKGKADQKKMLAFLKANFRPWKAVLGNDDGVKYVSDPDDDLSYAHGKNQIGFDYRAGFGGFDQEREYYFSALKWVALQVGKRSSKVRFDDTTHKFDSPVPVFIYDGYERWPILSEKPKKRGLRWCWVDKLGMKRDKDCVAEENRLLIWEHLIVVQPRKKGQKANEREVAVRDDIVSFIGMTPGEGVPQLSLEKQTALVKKFLWKEVQAFRAPIKAELARLDKLWHA